MFVPFMVVGQHHFFKHFTIEDGLVSSQTTSIFQDSRGYIWIGSTIGFSIYDGVKFTSFNTDWVTNIIELSDGNMAITSDGTGVMIVSPIGEVLQKIGQKEGMGSNIASVAVQDKQGNLWVGTLNGKTGMSKLVKKNNKYKVVKSYSTKDGLNYNAVWSLLVDKKGNLLVGTTNGINKLVNGKFINTNAAFAGKKSNNVPFVIIEMGESPEGRIFLGTNQGLYSTKDFKTSTIVAQGIGPIIGLDASQKGMLYFGGTRSIGLYVAKSSGNGKHKLQYHLKEEEGLLSSYVDDIFVDREKNIWIVTDAGVSMYYGKYFQYFNDNTSDIKENDIWAITKDKENNIWFGISNGLEKLNPKTFEFDASVRNKFINTNVQHTTRALLTDNEGNIWIGQDQGGLYEYSKKKGYQKFTVNNGLAGNSVRALIQDKKGNIWIGTKNSNEEDNPKNIGGVSVYNGKEFKSYHKEDGLISNTIYTIAESDDEVIWVGGTHGISKFKNGKLSSYPIKSKESQDLYVYSLVVDKTGTVWANVSGKLYTFDSNKNKYKPLFQNKKKDAEIGNVYAMTYVEKTDKLWMLTAKGIVGLDIGRYRKGDNKNIKYEIFGKVEGYKGVDGNQNAIYQEKNGTLWFGTYKGAIKFDPKNVKQNKIPPLTHIKSILLNRKKFDWSEYSKGNDKTTGLPVDLELPYNKNNLTFEWVGLSFKIPEKVRYQYKLEGADKDWSPMISDRSVTYPNLSNGDYTFMVRSMNDNGVWNQEPVIFKFRIRPPFWKTWWFYMLVIIAIAFALYGFVVYRTEALKRQKRHLEEMVNQRTQELQEEKKRVEEKNDEIESKNNALEHANKEITDSIIYAQRIQEAILPLKASIEDALTSHFILYKPRDIVSGDFYWFGKTGNKTIIAAVDCTGHGVPGAFMSMIGNTILNQIIIEKGVSEPDIILNRLHVEVTIALRQREDGVRTNDGMDLALITYDSDTNELTYAGANRPLFMLRRDSEEIDVIKGNKFPIGGVQMGAERIFTKHTYQVNPGDAIYIFSDGYPDQFGGPKGKKYMLKRFKRSILSVRKNEMKMQGEFLEQELLEWMDELEQVDDVLVIGVQF